MKMAAPEAILKRDMATSLGCWIAFITAITFWALYVWSCAPNFINL